MHTHARTTDDVTTENKEQKKRMFACQLVLSGENKALYTAYVLQSFKVSIGIKGIQIRLHRLKAEDVVLLTKKEGVQPEEENDIQQMSLTE